MTALIAVCFVASIAAASTGAYAIDATSAMEVPDDPEPRIAARVPPEIIVPDDCTLTDRQPLGKLAVDGAAALGTTTGGKNCYDTDRPSDSCRALVHFEHRRYRCSCLRGALCCFYRPRHG